MTQQQVPDKAPRGRIEGVMLKPLKVIADQRGRLMEVLRCDEEMFSQFGQVYITTAYAGAIKAWHYHRQQTDHWAVLSGMALVALYDRRESSTTRGHINEFCMGVHQPLLVRIPAGVVHGFKCISDTEVILLNIPTYPYNYDEPDEFRIPALDPSVPFCWDRPDA